MNIQSTEHLEQISIIDRSLTKTKDAIHHNLEQRTIDHNEHQSRRRSRHFTTESCLEYFTL